MQSYNPSAWIWENVESVDEEKDADNTNLSVLTAHVSDLQYECLPMKLNTYDYGLPQKRRRLFALTLATFNLGSGHGIALQQCSFCSRCVQPVSKKRLAANSGIGAAQEDHLLQDQRC